jgi:peptidyl-prolyl cis-trans isomerase C
MKQAHPLQSTSAARLTAFHMLRPLCSLPKAVTKEQTDAVVEDLKALKVKIEGEEGEEAQLAAFMAAAKEGSECPSAAQGGTLGRFKRGAMVPKFDDVVFSGEVGQVLGPVQTVFGAHLIWVKSRTLDTR